MKVNSIAKITDYLLYEAKLPLGKFEVTTRRYNKSSTSVVVFFINKEIMQTHVELGKGIMSLNTDNEQFQRGLQVLQENIYRLGMAVEVSTPQPETEGKLVTRKINVVGTDKKATLSEEKHQPDVGGAAISTGSLEELDNLFNMAQKATSRGKIEL